MIKYVHVNVVMFIDVIYDASWCTTLPHVHHYTVLQ